MAFCSFSDGVAMFDSTSIENIFLIDYMPTAPEGFIKVYLYFRMLAHHPELGGELADVARAMRMDPEEVCDAMDYWERKQLVRRLSDNPVSYELLPMLNAGSVDPMEREYYRYRDFHNSIQELFREPVKPQEHARAVDWLNVFGMEQDAITRLLSWQLSRSRAKKPNQGQIFRRAEEWVRRWSEQGIRTLAEVETAIAWEEGPAQTARAVLDRFSLRRQPTRDELECARRWLEDWGYSEEEILRACEGTVKGSNPSFGYLESILKSQMNPEEQHRAELKKVLRALNPMLQPTEGDLTAYAALLKEGFEPGTVRLAAELCHRSQSQPNFESIRIMLEDFSRHQALKEADARAYVAATDQKSARMRALLDRCGLDRRPRKSDLKLLETWMGWHGDALIDYAADCSRGRREPVSYMNKLLTAWHESGVTTVEAAGAEHAAAVAEKAASEKTNAANRPSNPALDYAQREYRDEDFGDDFFINLRQDWNKGGDEA